MQYQSCLIASASIFGSAGMGQTPVMTRGLCSIVDSGKQIAGLHRHRLCGGSTFE